MSIPFYRPGPHSVVGSLLLILILLLLVLTGLGVFRLYFDFDWTANSDETGQLFALRIRGGQSLNLFAAEPFGRLFWGVQALLLGLCILLPQFRLLGGSLLAVVVVCVLFLLRSLRTPDEFQIPLEFELLSVLVLYLVYVLFTVIHEMREQKRVGRLLNQFVPEELAAEYRRDPTGLAWHGEERIISVLFCDVLDFSSITQRLETSELAQWLNLYFAYVSKIVVRYRGSIDKYMGDSVMAVWGAPAASSTHAFDALNAGMDMQSEIDDLNDRYRSRGWPEVSMGIGISSGPAMVGPLGSEFRMDYTVVGDTVNVAQRLEAQTRKYKVPIIVGDRSAQELPDLLFRELDTIRVKGRTEPVTMYEPLGRREDASVSLLEQLELHEKAMQASKSARWDDALELFCELRDRWGPVERYELYIRGIEKLRDSRTSASQ
ncbi:MAG: adenylate/guanylate cyclase domain-containing protein [Granulosicoccus sp.]|nr:adenylate/guanylate cyclase domain-containing protein [Granulosicoccus sp.]